MTVVVYLVRGICIDTGLSRLQKDVLTILETNRTELVLLTHYHEDHSGNAAAVREQFGLPVLGHFKTQQLLENGFRILLYQHLVWGKPGKVKISLLPEIVEVNGLRLKPIFTPGHSPDHTVYLEENRGWLFSGDLYLADRIKYFRADEKFYDQIRTLRKVLTYEFESLFCSHRPQFEDGKKRIAAKLQYFEDLYGSVKNLYRKGCSGREIKARLSLREDYFIKWFTFGDLSRSNMIQAMINSIEEEEPALNKKNIIKAK